VGRSWGKLGAVGEQVQLGTVGCSWGTVKCSWRTVECSWEQWGTDGVQYIGKKGIRISNGIFQTLPHENWGWAEFLRKFIINFLQSLNSK
jgi:hypothetical protein